MGTTKCQTRLFAALLASFQAYDAYDKTTKIVDCGATELWMRTNLAFFAPGSVRMCRCFAQCLGKLREFIIACGGTLGKRGRHPL